MFFSPLSSPPYPSADAAKTSLNAASEWLRQQDVKPATLSFHCQNTSVLPDNIAAFCRFPLMQQEVHLVVTPPQPKQRWHLSTHHLKWKSSPHHRVLDLVGNAGLIDRQLELFVPTQVQHLHSTYSLPLVYRLICLPSCREGRRGAASCSGARTASGSRRGVALCDLSVSLSLRPPDDACVALSMPKVEWQSLGRDTPMAFTSRLLSLTMLGTPSCTRHGY